MLIENESNETCSRPAGERTVFVRHLGQTGTVLEQLEGGRVRVRLCTGTTVVLEADQVQDRQLLMG